MLVPKEGVPNFIHLDVEPDTSVADAKESISALFKENPKRNFYALDAYLQPYSVKIEKLAEKYAVVKNGKKETLHIPYDKFILHKVKTEVVTIDD